MQKVRIRYAPSPTGIPHVGNIRTALFNFLFARNNGGEFILRIEDTDQKRSTEEHIKDIEESLNLLNIKWDKSYLQSERLGIYKKHLEILKKKGVVYKDSGAWFFKIPKISREISWDDVVHKNVKFPTKVIEDFVIIKSDGFPTYHFASVVDDHEMQISHVIRGDEWISSTQKHLLIYQSFKWQPPYFCHLPSILGADGKKLSKREGAKSVQQYISEGYLPEALTNFLALLGWSPIGDREMFTLGDLVKEFSLERINKNSPIFNVEKLNWFNKKYLQKIDVKKFATQIKTFSKYAKNLNDQKFSKIINLVKDRMTTLADFDKYASIFFKKGDQSSPPKEKIEVAKKAVSVIKNWNEKSITENLDKFIDDNKLEAGDFKNTLRLSVFADNTPPIYESLAVLSKSEVESRIDHAFKESKN